ncbi:hypothetical protein BKA61DRAFT_681512 [Leptodontidium sp. MPI-SDFR-AT-0119]|nr:hypothetical protein BKA61DRAFT_681512 [Leptodontidium sp. MPI-SDFR-AT-0119]
MVGFYSDPALEQQHAAIFQTLKGSQSVLPPGINEAEFERILASFERIVGQKNIVVGSDLINFRDPYPLDEDAHQPSAAICPSSVEEIQAILKIANQDHVPLWITSRGKNFGYGGPAPRVPGSVVLSLHRMDRILEVNEQLGYVVVEPGTTFFDVNRYFKENDVGLWCGVPALGWGSVVGNTLDRGHGYTITGDRQHKIASMEVVLPSGEILRTGQWGVPNSPSTHACSNNFGPQVDGLFLQSNLGIVTKLGVYVDIAPPAYMSVAVHCSEVADIAPLIDSLQQLYREDTLQNHAHIVNINHFASRDSQKHMQQTQPGPLTEQVLSKLRQKYKTGYWRCVFDLYGPRSLVLARFARVEAVISKTVPQARLEHTLIEGENGKPVDNTKIGTLGVGAPSMFAAKLADYNLPADGSGAGAHIDVTLILPGEGKVVLDWFVKMRGLMEAHGADPFIGCHVFDKHILFVQEYVFDKTQAVHRERGRKVLVSILAAAETAGFASYRSHLQHMDAVQNLFSFNRHIYRRFVEQIKAAIDPNGIIAPGKQGIWPQKRIGKLPAQNL